MGISANRLDGQGHPAVAVPSAHLAESGTEPQGGNNSLSLSNLRHTTTVPQSGTLGRSVGDSELGYRWSQTGLGRLPAAHVFDELSRLTRLAEDSCSHAGYIFGKVRNQYGMGGIGSEANDGHIDWQIPSDTQHK